MIFKARVEENLLELTADRKKIIIRFVALCVIFFGGFAGMVIYDYYNSGSKQLVPQILMMIIFSAILFTTFRSYISNIIYGEVLTFDKKNGEFQINKKFQKRLDEFLQIELYHHSGDDKDYTYLDIIYTDNTYHRIDYVSIYHNEELMELGKLLGGFLNLSLIETHNRY